MLGGETDIVKSKGLTLTVIVIVVVAVFPSAPIAFMTILYVPGETEEATCIVAVAEALGVTVEGLNEAVIPLGADWRLKDTCLLYVPILVTVRVSVVEAPW